MEPVAINALFIFDANYLSPALVSVASFFETLGAKRLPVTLVFLVGDDEDANNKVRVVLQRFEEKLQSTYPGVSLQVVELRGNVFDGYVKRHHFSNAILYKAIIPQAFAHYDHILLFDCGMIFGQQLHDFLIWVENHIRSRKIATMAAFCVPSDRADGLSSELMHFPHHALYPAGGTLYFDVARYRQASIYDRLVSAFTIHRERLVYAEQDLLCLTLQPDELSAFDECGTRCHIDLAASDWGASEDHVRLDRSRDCFYIKHVGSFKPWKKWVLHPSKSIFLKERKKIVSLLGMGDLEFLRDSESFPENVGFLAQQLILQERYYETHPETMYGVVPTHMNSLSS